MSSEVHIEVTYPIATVRLDRPGRHNELDVEGWRALGAALDQLSEQSDIECVAVCGTGGPVLWAGAAIGTLREGREALDDAPAHLEAIGSALAAIQGCKAPTVAIIEGICVGGGLDIAASCDLRVCGESSRFGAPIDRSGLTMSYDELAPLVRLLGPSPVLELLLGGELIGAERARRAGLVNRVYPDIAVVEQGYGLVAGIAAGAPLVNLWHKRFVHRLLDQTPVTQEEREVATAAFATAAFGTPAGGASS